MACISWSYEQKVALRWVVGSNHSVSYRAWTDMFPQAEDFCGWRRQGQSPRVRYMTRCEFNELK